MNSERKSIAYIVHADHRRDYSAVREFGEEKAVFSAIARDFNADAAIDTARRILYSMDPKRDYLVMSGDPALCGICVAVCAERHGAVNVLRWDKIKLAYSLTRMNFDGGNNLNQF